MTRFMTHWCMWLTLSLMLIVTHPVTSHAQRGPCGPRDVILEQLESMFGEVPAGRGLIPGGSAITELLINPADGSWTFILTRPDGISCGVLSGDGWEFAVQEEKKGQGT